MIPKSIHIRLIHKTEDLLAYIENCIAEISHDFTLADIVLAGDLSQLSDQDIADCTGLVQVIYQPTRGASKLDRLFVSDPHMYSTIRVVTSVIKSDHKAIVAFPDKTQSIQLKRTKQHIFR